MIHPCTKKSKATISIVGGSLSQQFAAMEKELMNQNPQYDVLIAFMNSTFEDRKSLVDEKSVTEIAYLYPALKCSIIVYYLVLLLLLIAICF